MAEIALSSKSHTIQLALYPEREAALDVLLDSASIDKSCAMNVSVAWGGSSCYTGCIGFSILHTKRRR